MESLPSNPNGPAPKSMERQSFSRGRSELFRHYSRSRSNIQGITMEWSDLNYSILAKDPKASTLLRPVFKNKRILRSISGSACSGELVAIMGPTGCGKTSLLNVLAARLPSAGQARSELIGSVLVNGKQRIDKDFRSMSAYVYQDDRLYPHLTVQETLSVAAHFFLPNSASKETKNRLVDAVIEELGLGKARDTMIGDEKVKGISGGERKRANIGVQLISDPAVLFLDEPTSGLDSFQAQAVMESMKTLSVNGRLVVTVIHQPRSSIFDMFDQLMLLSEGRLIYLGAASAAAAHFAAVGYPMPRYYNPADFFLDMLSPDNRSEESEIETGGRILKFADAWAAAGLISKGRNVKMAGTESTQTVATQIADGGAIGSHDNSRAPTLPLADNGDLPATPSSAPPRSPSVHSSHHSKPAGTGSESKPTKTMMKRNFSSQAQTVQAQRADDGIILFGLIRINIRRYFNNLGLLFWRSAVEQKRSVAVFLVKVFISIFFSCLIGGIYSDTTSNQTGIRNRQGLLFITTINQGFNQAVAVLTSFPKEKNIVNRERSTKAYDTLSYFTAKFLAELPLNLVPSIVFGTLIYWIAGLNKDTFGPFLVILCIEAMSGIALGLFVSAFSPNVDVANACGIPLVIFFLVFGGFYINVESLPPVLDLLPAISFMHWAFRGYAINEFKGETFRCSGGSTSACFKTGDDVLESLSFDNLSLGYVIFAQSMTLVGYLVAAFLALLANRLSFTPLGFTGRALQQARSKASKASYKTSCKTSAAVSEVVCEGLEGGGVQGGLEDAFDNTTRAARAAASSSAAAAAFDRQRTEADLVKSTAEFNNAQVADGGITSSCSPQHRRALREPTTAGLPGACETTTDGRSVTHGEAREDTHRELPYRSEELSPVAFGQ